MSESLPQSEPKSAGVAEAIVAGWYGKLPSLGDFATRRLAGAFVEPWDAWLCERIAEAKQRLGERWLTLYLTCPVWRFFLMPGVLAAGSGDCWTGVVMASVDRVGRHFPLTIAGALPAAPATCSEIDGIWQWLSAVETVALAALDFDHTIERLDAQLAALPLPTETRVEQPAAASNMRWSVTPAMGFATQLAKELAPVWQTGLQGLSLWSAAQNALDDQETEATPRTFTIWRSGGMPDSELFIDMLSSRRP
jgi:type VI secretion system protein ImpM